MDLALFQEHPSSGRGWRPWALPCSPCWLPSSQRSIEGSVGGAWRAPAWPCPVPSEFGGTGCSGRWVCCRENSTGYRLEEDHRSHSPAPGQSPSLGLLTRSLLHASGDGKLTPSPTQSSPHRPRPDCWEASIFRRGNLPLQSEPSTLDLRASFQGNVWAQQNVGQICAHVFPVSSHPLSPTTLCRPQSGEEGRAHGAIPTRPPGSQPPGDQEGQTLGGAGLDISGTQTPGSGQ